MGNCIDCKHWSRFIEEKQFGRCELVNVYSELDNAEPDEMAAVLLTNESFTGDAFWTRPDFGCIQFEAKPIA